MSPLKLSLFLLALLMITPAVSTACSPGVIIIVSNSVDIEAARELNKALLKQGFPCFILRPDELWKAEHYSVDAMIYLGGPKAYEGIGEIVASYLTDDEEASLMEEGAMKIFVKLEDGKKIIILAGNTRNETREAVTYFFDKLVNVLKVPITGGEGANVIMVVVGTQPSSTPVGG